MRLKAISLIESLIYLALFAIFFLSVIQFMVSMADVNKAAREKQQLETASMFINNHLTQQFEDAQLVSVGADAFTLTVDGVSFLYTITNGEFTVTSQSVTEPLTPSFATASSLSVTAVVVGVTEIGLEIAMDLVSDKSELNTRHIDLTLLLGNL